MSAGAGAAAAAKTPGRLSAAKAATPGSARTLMDNLSLSGKGSILKALGTGTNLSELTKLLDPKEVSFALVKIPIGSGTFVRHKVVLCVLPAAGQCAPWNGALCSFGVRACELQPATLPHRRISPLPRAPALLLPLARQAAH